MSQFERGVHSASTLEQRAGRTKHWDLSALPTTGVSSGNGCNRPLNRFRKNPLKDPHPKKII
jgi:hypothetical protein